MLRCFSGTTYDVITFLICRIQKREYLQNENRYTKKENAIPLYSDKPFKQTAMDDLPVIRYPCLRKELWDRQGANSASR